MPARHSICAFTLLLAFLAARASAAIPGAVSVSAPTDVSVTVYRSPNGTSTSLDLDELGGFAFVTETRTVSFPAGESRLRFEGVADGIQSQSAIITGLPNGVLEKNHDAKVLSPSELVAATVGHAVWLVRTNPKTGKTTQERGTLVADTDGVIFKGSAGVEALRCSGWPETFAFEGSAAAAATPTLSVLINSPAPVTAEVKLSYLASGFDWMANYVATVSPDGSKFDLGAWVTLGNSNGVSFPDAHAQVVAGRLNRESGEVEPVDAGAAIAAQCWPRGSTSDTPEEPNVVRAVPLVDGPNIVIISANRRYAVMAATPLAMKEVMVTGSEVQQEQLGDLKLYRVPHRTSVTSRQIKQVRLLDQHDVPTELVYKADIEAGNQGDLDNWLPLHKVLRTRNDQAHHLGLPLPSGQVAAFYEQDGVPLLVNEAPLRDVADKEEFEIELGESPDVRWKVTEEKTSVDPSTVKKLPLLPHLHVRSIQESEVARLEVSNARATAVAAELSLVLPDGFEIVRADHIPTKRNGRPTFRLTIAANTTATIRFQLTETEDRDVPE
jgi:hypothetical protein